MRVLNMIVKNESKVIKRCLDSCKDFIDAVIISDTGSSDNTIEIINKWIKDNNKDGFVASHEWKNFEYNRNAALGDFFFAFGEKQFLKFFQEEKKRILLFVFVLVTCDTFLEKVFSKNFLDTCLDWTYKQESELGKKYDYVFFMDADDTVIPIDKEKFANEINLMKNDKCSITLKSENSSFSHTFAAKIPSKGEKVTCRWFDVLHEYFARDGSESHFNSAYVQVGRDGARNMDPMKYFRDALIFEAELKKNKDKPSPRHMFYLAQSYKDYGGPIFKKVAEKYYLKRAEMNEGWSEEKYISLLEAAKCRIDRGKNDSKTLELLMRAFNHQPKRLEAAYYIVNHFRINGKQIMGYTFGKSLLHLKPSPNFLFVDNDIYNWKFMDEVAVCSSWSADKVLYGSICRELIKNTHVPKQQLKRIMEEFKQFG